jgi:hypothetical protein
MDKTNETITIDIEMQARMANEHWNNLVKLNKYKFQSEEAEDACNKLFLMGYGLA